eukprot:scaffold254965_cov28-Tisochrysis_lutea.AAC.4
MHLPTPPPTELTTQTAFSCPLQIAKEKEMKEKRAMKAAAKQKKAKMQKVRRLCDPSVSLPDRCPSLVLPMLVYAADATHSHPHRFRSQSSRSTTSPSVSGVRMVPLQPPR